MKRVALLTVLTVAVLIAGLTMHASAQSPRPGDLIFFDGFESFGEGDAIAPGWVGWSATADMPEYRQANPWVGGNLGRLFGYRVHEGANAQQYFTVYQVHDAGLYRVVDVPPYSIVEVTGWAQAWSSGEDDPYHSDENQHVHIRIGADGTGGTTFSAGSVIWSEEINPLDQYQQVPPVRVGVDGKGKLTIFLRSAPMYALKHNDIYWDAISVTLVGYSQGGQESTGNSPPTSPPAAPPDPILDGLVSHQVQGSAGGWDGPISYVPAALVILSIALGWIGRQRATAVGFHQKRYRRS